MSGGFHGLRDRVVELEKQVQEISAERDHYFHQAEYFAAELSRLNAEAKGKARVSVAQGVEGAGDGGGAGEAEKARVSVAQGADGVEGRLCWALTGLRQVSLAEVAAAIGLHEPSKASLARIAAVLRARKWSMRWASSGPSRYVFHRPAEVALKKTG